MYSVFSGTSNIKCDSKISDSSISNCDIDLNNKVITNSGLPVNGTDVVNKNYVDSLVSVGLYVVTVTLTGVAYSVISPSSYGSFVITIRSLVEDGPGAIFNISKSGSTRHPNYSRISSSAGFSSHERLDILWDPSESIKINKTGLNYDGDYSVTILQS